MGTTNSANSLAGSMINPVDLANGEVYAGTARDASSGALRHVILMPAAPQTMLRWEDANSWAHALGGGLPTRDDWELIYALVRDRVYAGFAVDGPINPDHCYWMASEVDPVSWPYRKTFYRGGVSEGPKDGAYFVRLVRYVVAA